MILQQEYSSSDSSTSSDSSIDSSSFTYFKKKNSNITHLTIIHLNLDILYEANLMFLNLNKLTIKKMSKYNNGIYKYDKIRMNGVKELSIVAFDIDNIPKEVFFDEVESLKLAIKPTFWGEGRLRSHWLAFLNHQVNSNLTTLEIIANSLHYDTLKVLYETFPYLKSVKIWTKSQIYDFDIKNFLENCKNLEKMALRSILNRKEVDKMLKNLPWNVEIPNTSGKSRLIETNFKRCGRFF